MVVVVRVYDLTVVVMMMMSSRSIAAWVYTTYSMYHLHVPIDRSLSTIM